MRVLLCSLLLLPLGVGCARVSVQAPKEPIRVDISMRLDIYQHIQSDIDQIENMVTGAPEPSRGPRSLLDRWLVSDAHANTGLSPAVEAAALRRKDRRPQLLALQSRGVVGENHLGLVEIRSGAEPGASALVKAENDDRLLIYQSVAQKNGTSVREVQEIYAKRLQADAAAGTPIEIYQSSKGGLEWTIKK